MQSTIDWDTLYYSLHPKLMGYFRVRLATEQQAEDFVAMTFSRAWRRRLQYQPARGSVEAWVFGIARHLLIDYLRRNEPLDVPLEDVTLEADNSIEQTIEQQEELEQLYEILGVLSKRESRIISLKYGYEMRTQEIAAETGLSEANVAKIASRTIVKLRRFWELDGLLPS
jgi:RNA polymerase sigma-70 factor (ECF subfamily)